MNKTILTGVVLAITATLSTGVQAETTQYEKSIAQLKAQDYEQAAVSLQSLQNEGDARAAFTLAMMYHSGLSVEFDESKAVALYEVAATQGVVEAQEYMAAAYREGWWGLPMNYEKYRYWMDKAESTHL